MSYRAICYIATNSEISVLKDRTFCQEQRNRKYVDAYKPQRSVLVLSKKLSSNTKNMANMLDHHRSWMAAVVPKL